MDLPVISSFDKRPKIDMIRAWLRNNPNSTGYTELWKSSPSPKHFLRCPSKKLLTVGAICL